MEEILIHINNQDIIYYLSLFNNIIHNDNYFNIGNYEWLENNNLKIIYHNKNIKKLKNIDTLNNVKIFKLLNINNNIDETNTKKDKIIFIKHKDWEDNCTLNNESNKCYRNNQTNEQGIFKIFDNYLYINWDNWDSELFYKMDNDIYINHDKLITSYSFHYLDESKHFYLDDKSIFNENYYLSYIDSFLYYYEINDQLLRINNINIHSEFIKINQEFYEINDNYSYILNDSFIYLTGNQTVLNHHYQIIGTFIKNKEILKITHLNNEIVNFSIENNCLTQCENHESILIHNDSLFYLYIEHQLKKCSINKNQLLIDSKHYDFLMDNESRNIYIKYNYHVIQFNKLNNIYFEIKDFNFLNNINFDLHL